MLTFVFNPDLLFFLGSIAGFVIAIKEGHTTTAAYFAVSTFFSFFQTLFSFFWPELQPPYVDWNDLGLRPEIAPEEINSIKAKSSITEKQKAFIVEEKVESGEAVAPTPAPAPTPSPSG